MSGTHGTPTTAGPSPDPVPPEATAATGEPGARREAIDAVAGAVRDLLPADGLITDHARLRTYECDGLAHYKVTPALVVMPETADQLAAVVRACADHRVPFVARGSGTGLSGGALPRADGVLVVTSRMRAIREVRPDLLVTANPGCLMQVAAAIERSGHPMGMVHTIEILDASIRGVPIDDLTRRPAAAQTSSNRPTHTN